ncbi:reticulocyte binding protein, putative, fragment [Plasmodium vinckei lentum]|uniref:Reticulocyte binding protein, putative n=1 Tax=Plasmodium vinckei lentum TaxID=138297 RepID=A0A6V7S5K6_PLAVN|nr:reticulocyte binding protein, putative, fragment [Plasmodium vinckei lentum]
MLNHLIQKNLNITSDLRNRKQRMQNHNNIRTINRQHEVMQTQHACKYHHDINDTKNINKNCQYSSSDRKDFSQTINADEMDLDESEGFMMTLKMGVLKEKITYRNKYE